VLTPQLGLVRGSRRRWPTAAPPSLYVERDCHVRKPTVPQSDHRGVSLRLCGGGTDHCDELRAHRIVAGRNPAGMRATAHTSGLRCRRRHKQPRRWSNDSADPASGSRLSTTDLSRALAPGRPRHGPCLGGAIRE